MDKLQAFQATACAAGFVEVPPSADADDPSVVWLKKATAEAEDRICIDKLTKSATAYWATIPWKINSRTFREVAELQDWLLSRPAVLAS